MENKKGGFRKIKEYVNRNQCMNPEHNPPQYIVLEPGIYEYTCPACGEITIVDVPCKTL